MKMYRYFENNDRNVYDADNIEELSPEVLSYICAFQYTRIGAEGGGGRILMFDENGNYYAVYHTYLNKSRDDYESHAYVYINKYLDIKGKIEIPRYEQRTEKDGCTTITNGLGCTVSGDMLIILIKDAA